MARIAFADDAIALLPALCTAFDNPGDAIQITGDAIGGSLQVARCNPFDVTKMPAVGLLLSKSDATHAVVALFGVQPLAGFAPGARIFVGQDGRPSASPMVPPRTQPMLVQALGVAIDSARMLLVPSPDMIRVGPP